MSGMQARRKQPEADFQQQVFAYLASALDGNSWFSAIPLGGGGAVRGAILKRTGTKSGIPDVLCLNDGRAAWLELKSRRGQLSDAQLYCHECLRRAGSSVTVCKTLDQVEAALLEAGFRLKARITL